MDAEKKKRILRIVDHTLLSPVATAAALHCLCEEAIAYETASVCVMPKAVAGLRRDYPTLTLCTVVGFPLGYTTTGVKVAEAEDALASGADELDMVIDRGALKDGNDDAVTAEIAAVKRVCGDKILKVIIETCDLTEAEKVRACRCVTTGGADFIKTSTGFGKAGAVLTDIPLLRANIGADVKIKAAGGIRTAAELEAFFDAGCDRIGASSAVEVLK